MEKQLPKNWVSNQLSEIIEFVIGGDWGKDPQVFEDENYKQVLCIRGGEIKNWRKAKGKTASLRLIKNSSLVKRELKEGDILLEISGGGPEQPVGRVVYIDKDVLSFKPQIPKVSTNFLRLVRIYDTFSSKYINYYLQYFYVTGEVVNYQGGSNNLRNLKFKEYETIKIPLPPRAEQERIVAKLDSLFAELDIIKERLANIPTLLKNFRQSVLNQAVTGKLTEEWRKGKELENINNYIKKLKTEKNNYYENLKKEYENVNKKAPRKPSNKILEGSYVPLDIPKIWEEVRLSDLIVDLTDYHANGSYKKLKAHVTLKEENDYACMIRSTNFEKNNFKDLLIYINEYEYNFLHRSKLFGGEILISKIGNAGSVYLMPKLNRPASLAMNLFALRVNKAVNNEYLYYYLISDSGTKLINKYVRGVATKSIDKVSVRSIMVGLPSEEEQQEIVKRVEALFKQADNIQAHYEALVKRIEVLPQAILAKAFKGELVPQLPTDGDAKELLAEIKKLKESVAPKKKKRVVKK